MRLPPVDDYRAPFVVPIGHLAMQAAYADNKLFELVAACPPKAVEEAITVDTVAHKLRVWDDKTRPFAEERVRRIADLDLRAEAEHALSRYGDLKLRRNRAIHDAVEIGIFGSEETGYLPKPLQVEYRRVDGKTTQSWLHKVTPDLIASLAYELYDLQKDMEAVTYNLRQQREAPDA